MKKIFIIILFIGFAPLLVSSQEVIKRITIKHQDGEASAYSPDNQFLAVGGLGKVRIFNVASATEFLVLKDLSERIVSISYSPDSQFLVATSSLGEVAFWDAKGNLVQKMKLNGPGQASQFLDNQKIVFLDSKKIGLYDRVTEKWVWSKDHNVAGPRALAVTKEKIAYGGSTQKIYILNTDGEEQLVLSGHTDWIRSLDFHPKEPMLASGSDNGDVILWNLESKKQIRNFSAGKHRIYGLKFSIDGTALLYAGKSIVIWSIEKEAKLTELTSTKSQVLSLSLSLDGAFMAILEEELFYFSIYDLRPFNFQRTFLVQDQKDKTPPQIYVSNPANIREERVMLMTDFVQLKGSVFDDSGIQSLKVNGIETPIKNQSNFLINIPLTLGDNQVSIEVKDINGNIALRKFIVERKNMDGTAYNPSAARNYLLAVAIDDYKYITKLNNPVKDVSDVVKILLSKYKFEFEDLIFLKNEQATRNNIMESMRSLIEKLGPQDNLVIYFAGHGYFDKLLNEGYWVPVEAQNTYNDFIPNSSILKILDNIDTQHIFLVADACFSGSLFAATTRGYAENVEKFRSRWGLTSGRLELVADGEKGSNSPFARHFLNYLNQNASRSFAVSELVQYVKLKTADDTSQTPIGNPLKTLGDEGGEFVFYPKK